jgi:hypothetical protein
VVGKVLDEEAAGARAQGLVNVLVEVERCEDDNAHGLIPRALGSQLTRGGEAVEPWHPDVHQDQIWTQFAGELDRGASVPRLSDDLDVGLRLEDRAQAGEDERLIIRE